VPDLPVVACYNDEHISRSLCFRASIFASAFSSRLLSVIDYRPHFCKDQIKYPDVSLSVDASHTTRGINSVKRIFDFVSVRLGNPKVFYPDNKL